jgi:elongation factor G
MHADKMEDIEATGAGDIVALFGIDCASGDTFTAPGVRVAMTSMHVPKPVISLSVKPVDNRDADKLAKALARFVREDPTFKASVDAESGETVIAGMGELHLDVYVERMKREYGCAVQTGAPQVAYRECISARSEFNYTHRKQTGGAGQYAKVGGYIEPLPGGDGFEFSNEVRGGAVPTEYISACEKGFASACEKGSLIEAPVLGVRVVLNDGAAHAVDSSDLAFQLAARSAFREAYAKAKPVVLEPIMRVEIEGPSEFQGAYIKAIMQRRGLVVGSMDAEGFARVESQVPLAEMFGFATDLRSASQGKAEFTMEFARYAPVPPNVQQELIEAAAQNRTRK